MAAKKLALMFLATIILCGVTFSDGLSARNDQLLSSDFWKSIAPDMHIVDAEFSNALSFVLADNGTATYLRELIKDEGYIQLDPIAFSPISIIRMVETVERLHALDLPLPFAYIYDEFWLIFVAMHHVISAMIGPNYSRLPDFWAWRVDPQKEEKGWNFHRDKMFRTIGDDNLPDALTVWIPLTDATTLNGCMYMLPADRDPTYNLVESETGERRNLVSNLPIMEVIENFRALPADASSVLMWNQQVYHYGSRASRRAAAPRISLAVEFQSADIPPLNVPLLDPLSIPSFEDRLQLIAKQIIQYKHMYPLDEETLLFAQSIIHK